MFVLDTNVVSELMRRTPERAVVAWIEHHHGSSLFLTAVTEAELRVGAAILPAGARRDALEARIDEYVFTEFSGRVLPFDSAAASAYAGIVARRRRIGRPAAHADTQIAAISQVHGMSVVTRNVADFADAGIEVVNPWPQS